MFLLYLILIYYSNVVLHPRHKLQYFRSAGWEAEWIETARKIVRDEFDRTYAFMDVDIPDEEVDEEVNLLSF